MVEPRYVIEIFDEDHPEDAIVTTDWWLDKDDAIAWAKKIQLMSTNLDYRLVQIDGYYEDEGYWIETSRKVVENAL